VADLKEKKRVTEKLFIFTGPKISFLALNKASLELDSELPGKSQKFTEKSIFLLNF
jgi:hypothetical protein